MVKVHDGSDYNQRQRILPHYKVLALSKKRLKFTIILHMMLGFLMAAKMVSTVLDMLNIFVQPIEELYIPMARPWEWVWLSSILLASITLQAIKTNNILQLKIFLVGVLLTCIFPLIYCAYLYSADFRTFVITRDASKTSEVWRGYPVAFYWYVFIIVACQIHGAELYLGLELHRCMGKQKSPSKRM